MFRSRRRSIVVPQAEHARLAAAIAAAWGNERFPSPPLPFAAFVRGVAEHDRGYGELDADPIGEVSRERWLAIQQAGFLPRGDDAVVDAIVALHVRRLVGDDPLGAEMDVALPALLAAAGLVPAEAQTADAVTGLCDYVSFDLCCEEPAEDAFGGVAYRVDGAGRAELEPWPLAVPELAGTYQAYQADGYPHRLLPVAVPFLITPLP